jgi:hypothetical protein
MHRADNNSEVRTGRGRTSIRAQIVMLLCAVLFGSGEGRLASAQGSAEEYQVKAAFLFHFAQLVEWPADALNASDLSINLCIFNDEPRRKELQDTIVGKPIGVRVLRVSMLDPQQSLQGCNILFLGRDESRRQAAVLKRARDLPVLTVGETDDFLSDGGMIHFHLDGDKMRFDINADVADLAHLKISSRLLLLATSVTHSAAKGAEKVNYAH